MKVQDIMTTNPACCTPDMSMKEVARMMVEHDCGEIPVVESRKTPKPIGVVTDRDICCRGVAEGRDPGTKIAEVMTHPVVTVTPETDLDELCRVMEDNKIRRVPVVDGAGCCCGIVSVGDVIENVDSELVIEVMREVSLPTDEESRVP
jgi:CBS domain-containing protein